MEVDCHHVADGGHHRLSSPCWMLYQMCCRMNHSGRFFLFHAQHAQHRHEFNIVDIKKKRSLTGNLTGKKL